MRELTGEPAEATLALLLSWRSASGIWASELLRRLEEVAAGGRYRGISDFIRDLGSLSLTLLLWLLLLWVFLL